MTIKFFQGFLGGTVLRGMGILLTGGLADMMEKHGPCQWSVLDTNYREIPSLVHKK